MVSVMMWCGPRGHLAEARGWHRSTARHQSSRFAAASSKDTAATLVETVAALALRTRLKRYDDVAFDVDCNMGGLLSGRVQAVQMIGKGWESPQGLTARLLQISLGQVAIDAGALLSERRIKLAHMPTGQARVLFTAQDFSAFLNHPLMVKAASRAIQGQPFLFDKDSVVLHQGRNSGAGVTVKGSSGAREQYAATGARGSWNGQPGAAKEPVLDAQTGWPLSPSVMFTGRWAGRVYQVCLQPAHDGHGSHTGPRDAVNSHAGRGVRVTAIQLALAELYSSHQQHVENASWAERLKCLHGWDGLTQDELLASQALTQFFQTLMIDLQGAELRFASLSLMPAAEARSWDQSQPLIDLRLGLRVRDFPP